MHIAEESRWIKKSARGQRDLRLPAGCALGDTLLHHALDALQLHTRHDCADVDGLVERLTDSQGAHTLPNLSEQIFGDALLHQQARPRAAHLPLVKPDSVYETFDCAVEIGVVENNERGFSS